MGNLIDDLLTFSRTSIEPMHEELVDCRRSWKKW